MVLWGEKRWEVFRITGQRCWKEKCPRRFLTPLLQARLLKWVQAFGCDAFTYFPSVFLLLAMCIGSFFLFTPKPSSLFCPLKIRKWEYFYVEVMFQYFCFLHNLYFPEIWTRIPHGSMDFRIRSFGHFDSVMGGKNCFPEPNNFIAFQNHVQNRDPICSTAFPLSTVLTVTHQNKQLNKGASAFYDNIFFKIQDSSRKGF